MSNDIELEEDLYDEDEEDTQKDIYFSFRVENEEYGIEIMYVNEVIGLQKITEVPDMPDFVKGVINLRGKVIPVMDVRKRFGMKLVEYTDCTCIIVADIKDNAVGMIVDEVKDVLHIPEKNIDPPPKIKRNESSLFVQGLGKVEDEVKILLDVNKLLYEEELDQVASPSWVQG